MKNLRIYHPHTHEGVAYDPPPEGIVLRVNAADAAFLMVLGLTTPTPALDAPITSDDAHVVAPEDTTA